MSLNRKSISKNKSWNTPPKYVKLIEEFFGVINLDPCSNEFSLINADIKYCLPINGLVEHWNYKNIYVNPPYGKDIDAKTSIYNWINKGYEAYKNNKSEILFLIPVATNTKHFKELIFKYACGICFLSDTRLKFWYEGIEDKKGAPMACCIVYFGLDFQKFQKIFKNSGFVCQLNK